MFSSNEALKERTKRFQVNILREFPKVSLDSCDSFSRQGQILALFIVRSSVGVNPK